MKFKLIDANNKMLNEFFVDAKDREYQFWKGNPLSIDLWTEEVFIQKLNYIHNNPINYPWNLVQHPEEYKYSSAKFYETGIDEFGLLTPSVGASMRLSLLLGVLVPVNANYNPLSGNRALFSATFYYDGANHFKC